MPMQISFIVNLTLESSRYANQTIESLLGYELEKNSIEFAHLFLLIIDIFLWKTFPSLASTI